MNNNSSSNSEPQLVRFTGTFFQGLGGINNNNNGKRGGEEEGSTNNTNNTNNNKFGSNKNGRNQQYSTPYITGQVVKSSAIAHARPLQSMMALQQQQQSGARRGRNGEEEQKQAQQIGNKAVVRPDLRFGNESSGKQLQHDISWLELGLCKSLTRAVTHLGYLHPTPVQSAAIPHIITGHDCVARAVTGSGKTAAFMLPLVHRLVTTKMGHSKYVTSHGAPKKNVMNGILRSLILLPSRELGMQVHDFAFSLAQFCDSLKTVLVIGGVAAQAQESALAAGADIVVATPGRIIDLLYNYSNIEQARHTPFSTKSAATVAGSKTNRGRKFDLSAVEMVALDECDELLSSETLRPQILDIFTKFLPPMERRQTVLLSATLTKRVDDFIEEHLKDDLRVVDIGHVAFAAQLRQHFIRCGNVSTVVKDDDDDAKPKKKSSSSKNSSSSAAAITNKDAEQDDSRGKSNKVSTNDDIEAGESEEIVHSSKRKTPYLVTACRKFYGAQSMLEQKKKTEKETSKTTSKKKTAGKKSSKKQEEESDDNDNEDDNNNQNEGDDHKRVLIFAKYRSTVHRLCIIFQQLGFQAAELRGDLDIETRSQAISDFSSGIVSYLFTTDVASRGLDLPAVSTVINFDLPPTLSAYVHRVGRTARIGHPGVAVSLVDDDSDGDLMRRIMALSKSESSHQVASVKRREVDANDVARAMKEVTDIFPRVKSILASEVVEKQLEMAEKKMKHLDHLTDRQSALDAALTTQQDTKESRGKKKVNRVAVVAQAALPQARKQWTLSKTERSKREEAAKEVYKNEVESKLTALREQADEPNAALQRANQRQVDSRRKERERESAKKAKEKEYRKTQRKRELQKVQAGKLKKLKQKKIRQGKMEERKAKREAGGGGKAGKKRQGSAKKPATRKKFRRH